jgi:hypothetical protein
MKRPAPMLVTIAFAVLATLLTRFGQWWCVALLPFVATIADRARPGPVWPFTLGAALSWSLLLLFDAMGGRMSALTRTLAGVMHVPWPVLALATVAFAALLAWSAAVVGQELARLTTRWRTSRA